LVKKLKQLDLGIESFAMDVKHPRFKEYQALVLSAYKAWHTAKHAHFETETDHQIAIERAKQLRSDEQALYQLIADES